MTLTVIGGHNWTVFLKFKGGKGVATSTGALLGLGVYSPGFFVVIFLSIAVWILVFLVSRIVAVASLIAALAVPVLVYFFSKDFMALSIIICVFIFIRHHSNIKRLFKGQERPLKF